MRPIVTLSVFSVLSLLCAGRALAQQSITLPLPAARAGADCQPATGDGGEQVTLRRTFFDDFRALDLSGQRWTPHYDGGYDDNKKRWQGYDWVVKRTAPAAREQQIYVDPDYRGSGRQALRLNPFKTGQGGLVITAERIGEDQAGNLPGFQFTSGLLTTRQSFTQLYGYFEMRGKVPAGKHLLPAFWLLADDRHWPQELDVMEAPGHVPGMIQTTLHWEEGGKSRQSACRNPLGGFDQASHRYGALWTPERVIYYIDRKPVAQVATPASFTKPMYMILNLAVGGNWVGMATADTPMPARFEVNNVAAYTMGDPAACTTAVNGVKTCQGK